MKIIKKNNVSAKEIRIICSKCNSELEINREDVSKTHIDININDYFDNRIGCICPVCLKDIVLNTDQLSAL